MILGYLNIFRPTQTVFHTMAARFQTVPCTSTRINMYPSTTSIPPVRFPFVIMRQSHNMSISPQTAAAFGCVGHLQILRLVSLRAPHAPLGQGNALTYARVGMGSFTSHSFLTIGKMTSYSKRIEGPEFQTNCRFNWPEGPTCVWPADYEGDCTMEPVECP